MINHNKISILGVTIDKENFPILYKGAKENLGMLELQLEIVAKNWGTRSIKSVMQTIESSEPIEILEKKLDPLYFPVLYKWAQEHPETLKSRVRSIAKAWHEGNITSALQAMESDLQHG